MQVSNSGRASYTCPRTNSVGPSWLREPFQDVQVSLYWKALSCLVGNLECVTVSNNARYTNKKLSTTTIIAQRYYNAHQFVLGRLRHKKTTICDEREGMALLKKFWVSSKDMYRYLSHSYHQKRCDNDNRRKPRRSVRVRSQRHALRKVTSTWLHARAQRIMIGDEFIPVVRKECSQATRWKLGAM